MLYSTLIIVNQQGLVQKVVIDCLNKYERNDQRKQQILTHISTMVGTLTLNGVDPKEKRNFGTQFNELKVFIYSL